jgi:hypothetical protein
VLGDKLGLLLADSPGCGIEAGQDHKNEYIEGSFHIDYLVHKYTIFMTNWQKKGAGKQVD